MDAAWSAQGVRRWESGGAAALGSPYGGAGERSETERAQAVANLGKVRRLLPGTLSVMGLFPDLQLHPPSQSRLRRASSPIGRAKGRALPAQRTEIFARSFGCAARLIHHPLPNRVTPSGVGQLPGSQARHSQRALPARQTFSLLLFTYSTNFCSTAVRTMSLRQVR